MRSVKSGIAQEEIFGPVACLIQFKDEADAIAKANDIQYGLSSYVWTADFIFLFLAKINSPTW